MRMRVTAILAAFAVSASGAFAFDEQKSVPLTPAPSSGLAGASKLDPKGDGGTKLEIPGIGHFGVIPKLDFGLDLLYGADRNRPQVAEEPAQDDGLRIRGSIKHRF